MFLLRRSLIKPIVFILIFGLLYLAGSELSASRKAAKFCDSVSIGESAEDLLEDAIDAGARASATQWVRSGRGRSLLVTFTGFAPGSDFICMINEVNGKVVSKQAHLATSIFEKMLKKRGSSQ